MKLSRRLAGISGPALIVGAALYSLFYGSIVGGFGLGDDYWMLSLSVHGLSILAITVGLIGGHEALELRGWQSTLWWISTVFAFLGLTIANLWFSVAVLGLAAVAFSIRSISVGAMLVFGGALWMYLYAAGVRVGDENARMPTSVEEVVGVVAVVLMSLGLIGIGVKAIPRTRQTIGKTSPA